MYACASTLRIEINEHLDMFAGCKTEDVELEIYREEHLEINCLVLWQEIHLPPVLILTIDALYPGNLVRRMVENSATNVPNENIFIASSHTHQAPVTDDSLPGLGSPHSNFLKRLENDLSSLISTLLFSTERIKVEVYAGNTQATHSINRRKPIRFQHLARVLKKNIIRMAPNRKGPVDELITVIRITATDGNDVAILWNYACHPVSHPDPSKFASHYPGYVREKIRDLKSDKLLPILFFQGFSGDTRPSSSVNNSITLSNLLNKIFVGSTFKQMSEEIYKSWCQTLSEVVINTSLNKITNELSLFTRKIKLPGTDFAYGKSFTVTFARVSIGRDIEIYGVSAELVSEYSFFVRSKSRAKHVLCVGCIDSSFGYIPTTEMILEGGYESNGYCKSFSLTELNPSIEVNTIKAFDKLGY